MTNKVEQIKNHYNFTSSDVKNLHNILPVMEARRLDFVKEFYEYVKNFDEADKYLKDETIIKRHQDMLGKWYLGLFSGEYGTAYFRELEDVGLAHVKIKLPAHYVNAAMHFAKGYMINAVRADVKDTEELPFYIKSLVKILDINLDIFTSSYIEEEKRSIFLSHKLESFMIQFAKRFSYGLNLVLVVGLVALGIMVMGLFAYDLTHIFDGNIEKGLLSTLGSLLMLWVVIELVDTEIKHLQGGKFAIKVFVSVALVAVIRKILVTTLSADAIDAQISLIAAIAVLGVVYWLISKVEKD
ncbi:MAG: phosphate-starvation-inducible PsiE family protein [Deltaproteobacteria bacterium]|nr:phosphate-starvation-inducible PsiE family protein [Deltaproteobacteria bacterium]